MFGGGDQVDNTPLLCPKCNQQIFWIYDLGNGPAAGTIVLAMKCSNVNCQTQQNKVLLPSMTESAGSAEEITPLPGQPKPPENMLLCGRTGLAQSPAAPDGVCRGSKFRVFNRGNEHFSRCQACGHGDPIGNDYHAGVQG